MNSNLACSSRFWKMSNHPLLCFRIWVTHFWRKAMTFWFYLDTEDMMESVAGTVRKVETVSPEQYSKFVDERLSECVTPVSDPLPNNKLPLFSRSVVKAPFERKAAIIEDWLKFILAAISGLSGKRCWCGSVLLSRKSCLPAISVIGRKTAAWPTKADLMPCLEGFHSVGPHSFKLRSLEPYPLSRIPLGRIPLGRIPSGRIPLGRIPISRCPLSRIPFSRTSIISPSTRLALRASLVVWFQSIPNDIPCLTVINWTVHTNNCSKTLASTSKQLTSCSRPFYARCVLLTMIGRPLCSISPIY